ncbi:MAG: ABC transporter substrate-binding protein [Chromatiales bacterium]|nr:ABC transporter substrate-binding protein [Chromatiales bacterium]
MRLPLVFALALLASQNLFAAHGVAMHGDLKYGADFSHFEYTHPGAPKGGAVRQSAIGSFDSINPFILKGNKASGLGLTFDTLTEQPDDEPFSAYGLIAEDIEMPEDRSWVIYTLRPEACFHDGSPITPEDVIFSLEILKTKGHPFYRAYFGDVVKAEKLGEHKVKFSFTPGVNRELALIIGQLPVLSKAWWEGKEFDKPGLEPIMGSGPYRITDVEPGRSITYERVKDYWGTNTPVNNGRYNFGRLRFDYYRDSNVALEAFKAGEFDFRAENTSKLWDSGYDSPALAAGMIKKELIPHQQPTGMQALAFNTRRSIFKDRRVREALGYAFDFEWSNKNLFNSAYTRTESFFSNSELASSGLPSEEELAILKPYKGRVPDEAFTQEYKAPSTDGSGNIRANLRKAVGLLREAGWKVKNGKLANERTGEQMSFEILLVQPAFERVVLPFARNLERLGIEARVRTVDSAQYENRVRDFDFDMVVQSFGQSMSPGNEQRDFWASASADEPGSKNIVGIKDPVVDELIAGIISAPDRKSLVNRTRALDRVLLWSHYVIPQWHLRFFRVAYWDLFARPSVSPLYGLGFDTWWVDPAGEARIKAYRGK